MAHHLLNRKLSLEVAPTPLLLICSFKFRCVLGTLLELVFPVSL